MRTPEITCPELAVMGPEVEKVVVRVPAVVVGVAPEGVAVVAALLEALGVALVADALLADADDPIALLVDAVWVDWGVTAVIVAVGGELAFGAALVDGETASAVASGEDTQQDLPTPGAASPGNLLMSHQTLSVCVAST
jgi:hypothetical protein